MFEVERIQVVEIKKNKIYSNDRVNDDNDKHVHLVYLELLLDYQPIENHYFLTNEENLLATSIGDSLPNGFVASSN